MEENINWNLASNAQLKEECEHLEKEFVKNQEKLGKIVSKIDEYNNVLNELSKQYRVVKDILNKREGKK